MKLSIIVPVYNMVAGEKLEFCLDSLMNQTISDYEIIAVNDASTDDSLIVLNWYKSHYPDKFKVIDLPENRKQGGAKNAGLDMASGEFIGFVDSDDWIRSDMYEKLLNKAQETGADVVGCDYCITYQQSFEVGEIVSCSRENQSGILDEERHKSLILDPGSLVIKIYRREIFEKEPRIRFPEKIFYEDNAVATQIFLRATHYEYIAEPLYYYYQHSTSTVHVVTEERCVNRLESMRFMLQRAREDGSLEKYPKEIEFCFTNLFYQNTLFSYMQGVKRVRVSFIRALGGAMKKCFPKFQENPYYVERVHPEQKKFIAIQQKSTILFIMYYKFVFFVRRIKKWIRRKKKEA